MWAGPHTGTSPGRHRSRVQARAVLRQQEVPGVGIGNGDNANFGDAACGRGSYLVLKDLTRALPVLTGYMAAVRSSPQQKSRLPDSNPAIECGPPAMNTASKIKTPSLTLTLVLFLAAAALATASERRVLVYTRNGKGYVHDNIAASVVALKKLGAENHLAMDVSDDPAVFTDANLRRYKVLVFDNTNNEIFDNAEQRAAFQRYIRGVKRLQSPKGAEQAAWTGADAALGRGFVAIHSTSGAEREWPWFWELLGGKFLRHPKMQTFTVKVIDPNDPSTAHLPPTFRWTDEFYFLDHMPEGLHVLLAGDLTTLNDPAKAQYPGKKFGDEFPLAWRHQFEGSRSWYTALGHQKEHYSDPLLMQHILGGILWAMGAKP
jgi:uncharacterized protein